MNPWLIIFAFLTGGLLWLLFQFLWKPLGKSVTRLADDAKQIILEEDEEKEE